MYMTGWLYATGIDGMLISRIRMPRPHFAQMYKLFMRAYRHKHVLRHAGKILTSRNEVSEKARPFFVCIYIYLRQAILVRGRVPLCLHLPFPL